MKGTGWLFQIRHFSVKCADTSSDVQSPKPGCVGTKRLHASHSKISKWFHKLALPHFFPSNLWLIRLTFMMNSNHPVPSLNLQRKPLKMWPAISWNSEIATFEIRWYPPNFAQITPGNHLQRWNDIYHEEAMFYWYISWVLASDSSGASVLTPLSCTWIKIRPSPAFTLHLHRFFETYNCFILTMRLFHGIKGN